MKVLIHRNRSAAESACALRIAAAIRGNPRLVLGLATGRTPVAVYGLLAEQVAQRALSFRDVTAFNLDEYVGLGPAHPQSFR